LHKAKLVNLNTIQNQPHNHPLAPPSTEMDELSSVPQHVVHLGTRATPSEWRWTRQPRWYNSSACSKPTL